MVKHKRKLLIIAVLPAVTILAVWFFHRRAVFSKEIRNVLLISIDTCRADHLSCYGYPRKTTPNIDAVASRGILFENVISPVPLTLPAHCSMLTGTIPPFHGIHDNIDNYLSDINISLGEILKSNGFATGAVVSSIVLDSQFGLNQGFGTYNDKFESNEEPDSADPLERIGKETSDYASKWMQEHQAEKFFFFLHYYDPHHPHSSPEPYKSRFMESPYSGEIAYTDHCIGQVIDKLKNLGLYESTLIIITSDHGESLGEHGEYYHGYFVYQSTLEVPLIIKMPGQQKGRKSKQLAGLIDIVPTVLGALGIDVPSNVAGKNLLRLTDNKTTAEERYLYCESLRPTRYRCNSLLGVVSDNFKYIQTTRPELYNLRTDPGEKNNLAEKQPYKSRLMQDMLKQKLESSVRSSEDESRLVIDQENKKRLESLGYTTAGNIDESFEFDQDKHDPKDYIEFNEKNMAVNYYISQKEFAKAREICEQLISRYPGLAYSYYLLGNVYLYEESFNKAIELYSQALKIEPDFMDANFNLGVSYYQSGKYNEALKYWNEVLRFGGSLEVFVRVANTYSHLGKLDEAVTYFEKSLQLESEDAQIHVDFADVLRQKGQFEESIRHLCRALRINPNQPQICNRVAELLVTQGRIEEAIGYWKKTLEIKPNWPRVLNNLGWIMATSTNKKLFNPKDALQYAIKACELTKYEDPETLDTLGVAYAAKGEFDKAIRTAEKAEEMFSSRGMEKKALDIRSRSELYKAGKPYRE